uniref:Uncharacterized protein n=1 Tax=Candidatus Kentrum sp. DK TaxID=2126562 RepID=A0A450SQY2_9GAMM|nr:MAG: hypothetical protein BECKDK2373B_GA0170837_105727 [Candidatus Kentron sp. DK]
MIDTVGRAGYRFPDFITVVKDTIRHHLTLYHHSRFCPEARALRDAIPGKTIRIYEEKPL